MTPATWGLLAAGGVLGTFARFGLAGWLAARAADGGAPGLWAVPLGTLGVNLAGSFVIGVVAALAVGRPSVVTPEARLFLAVGFCGAFTTFSSFGLELLGMVQAGRWDQALAYMAVSNALGLAAVALGWALARA
jgi:CrcB protein